MTMLKDMPTPLICSD